MISPRIAEDTKVLVLYDVPQHAVWNVRGSCGKEGVLSLLQGMKAGGIDFSNVSMQCLSDDIDGKAKGYKEKADHVKDLVDTLAPNVVLLASAKAHEKFTGMKGASKFYGRVWRTDDSFQKLITIPPYSILKYNPNLADTITSTISLLKREMEFPELRETITEKNYILVDSMDKFRTWFQKYQQVDRYALDIETSSLQFNAGKVLTIQFSEGAGCGWCIPTNNYHGEWSAAEWEEIIVGIKTVVEDDNKERILANCYFDLKYLAHAYGFRLPSKNVTDVLIQSFLVDENRESHSLKFCAATLIEGAGDYERPLHEFISKFCKEQKIKRADFTYDLVPLDTLYPYGCMDVDYTYQLADYFKPLIISEEQVQVNKDVHRYAWALARIEMTGWQVDLEEAQKYADELVVRVAELKISLQELPEISKTTAYITRETLIKKNSVRVKPLEYLPEPIVFLVNSVNHKRVLFQTILKLPEIKKTKKGGYATDKECFVAWSEKFPDIKSLAIIKKIEELSKMLSTYVSALLVRSVNSRIHCSYRVTGTATGRISASQPNLQNVSQHSDEAKRLKKCFVALPGHSLVACDLSNAELRVTAAISKDPVMCNSFSLGLDPHSSTAKAVFNLDCEVSEIKDNYKEFRQRAKTLNFAALYGSSAMNIAKSLTMSTDDAQQLLDDYFKKHKGVTKMFRNNISYAKQHGYVVYPSGRRRRVPYINSDDKALKAKAERQINNSVIQGSSSDIALEALANMWEEIDSKDLPYKIINVIHDSIEMEVPDEHIDAAVEFITRNMGIWGSHLSADFPMKSDAEVGKTWEDLKEVAHGTITVEDEDSEEEEDEE